MTTYGKDSGIAVTAVRVSNFRSLANIEVELSDLTVLIGANNAGKTSFLDAMFAAIGVGRKALGADDVRLEPAEAAAPKTRLITIDILIRPVDDDGRVLSTYPAGSFWTSLWGTHGIATDDKDFHEFTPIRTTLAWSAVRGEYVMERKFLKEWRTFDGWLGTPVNDRSIASGQIEPIALHYIDAKRDLSEDLKRQGSFWRRLTEDLGLDPADIAAMEQTLSDINQAIVDKSEILRHLKENLSGLQSVVSADSGGVEISPVARKLRDLSKGVDVSFGIEGAQSFPLARHGMGTRSLASLLVFRAFASWRHRNATMSGDRFHSILALEEPESHLHPQAQRSLFGHIKKIPGQRVVSTHSPYLAGQAQLDELRLFIKKAGATVVSKVDVSGLKDPNDVRQLQETVIDTRGDILFARALVLFEGQTEEQALPLWAQEYWGASIHELGFCFVRANGTNYFPFLYLAKTLGIPWYIFADGESQPVKELDAALKKVGEPGSDMNPRVVVHPAGQNFESALIAEGYVKEIEVALDSMSGTPGYLDGFIKDLNGQKKRGNVVRDYLSAGGRERAALDAISAAKTSVSKHLATTIIALPDPAKRFPSTIAKFFALVSVSEGLEKA
ncbi:AAA family ATPase [Stenotrophomonas sp. PS02289]|uniref:ATP-dependent nuclease n=1 Tax=Stenotrophomonas sp. PS02289 TaxID=2991422 RepID=UPI00249BCCA1|nr:AAA family ATPase [Stenotrophomonas sp. PS02289]